MSLEHRQTVQQRQLLAPNLALALDILRMPLMELRAFLQVQVEDNPYLELDEPDQDGLAAGSDGEGATAEGPDLQEEWLSHWTTAENEGPADLPEDGRAAAGPTSLYETLTLQLGCQPLSEDDQRLALFLIHHLDEAGYLEGSLPELAREASATVEALEQALRLLQRFEPPGVAARNLQECLMLQLEARQAADTLAYRIARDHFPLFLEGRLPLLAHVTGTTPGQTRQACEQLRRLNPKPGTACSIEVSPTIVPDLIVHHREQHYDVELNDRAVPELTLSRVYGRMLRDPSTPSDAREFLATKARQAAWVIKAVEERNATLLAIGRCLISLQRDVLQGGPAATRPLTQAQVAALIGRHPSTVSRAIAGKTIDTPFGIVALEQLFASTVPQRDGNGVSDERIKAEIRQLVEHEDPRGALSDAALAGRLAQRNIAVARRTIAKYRSLLKIPPAHLRRRRM